MNFSLKKKVAAGAAVATLVGGVGAAFGYWTSTGTGSGSATAGTDTAWVVDADEETAVALTPGGPSQTVDFTVTNNSTGVQGLQAVEIKVANTDGTPWSSGGCDADDFSIGDSTAGDAHTITYSPVVNVAANGGVHGDDVTVQMVNKATENQDDCKSVTVPLYLSAS